MKKFLIGFGSQLTVLLSVLALFKACIFGYRYFFIGGIFDIVFYARMFGWLISSCILLHSVYLLNRSKYLGIIFPILITVPFSLLKGYQNGFWFILVLPSIYILILIISISRQYFSHDSFDSKKISIEKRPVFLSDKYYWAVPLWGLGVFIVLIKISILAFGGHTANKARLVLYLCMIMVLVFVLIFLRFKNRKSIKMRSFPGFDLGIFILLFLVILFCINKYIHTGTHGRVASPQDVTMHRYLRLIKDDKFKATRSIWFNRGEKHRVIAGAEIVSRLDNIRLVRESYHDGTNSYSSGSTNILLRKVGAPEWETEPDELHLQINSQNKDYGDSRASGYTRTYQVDFMDSTISMYVRFGKKWIGNKSYIRGISLHGDYKTMSKLLSGIDHDFKVREIRRGSLPEIDLPEFKIEALTKSKFFKENNFKAEGNQFIFNNRTFIDFYQKDTLEKIKVEIDSESGQYVSQTGYFKERKKMDQFIADFIYAATDGRVKKSDLSEILPKIKLGYTGDASVFGNIFQGLGSKRIDHYYIEIERSIIKEYIVTIKPIHIVEQEEQEIEKFKKKLNTGDAESYILKGMLANEQRWLSPSRDVFNKSLRESIKFYQEAVKLSPNNPDANLLLAKAYILVKNYYKGIEVLSKYLKLVPDNVYAHYYLGRIYAKQGHYRKVEHITNKGIVLLELNKQSSGLYKYYEWSVLDESDHETVYRALHYLYGKSLKEIGRYTEAILAYRKVIDKRSLNEFMNSEGRILVELGEIYLLNKNYERAQQLLDSLRKNIRFTRWADELEAMIKKEME